MVEAISIENTRTLLIYDLRVSIKAALAAGFTAGYGACTRLRSVLALFIVLFLFPTLAQAAWYDSGWSYRQKITILSTLADADLSNFPYLVKITDAANPLFADAQIDGDDILFTAADGTTKLNHEIEKYNPATNELYIWVQVPSILGTVNTEIYMYYGNGSATNQQSVEATWDDDFVMVQHLQETSGTHFDSTSKNNDGTPLNGVVQTATGKIDGADQFDGSNDKVDVADSATLRVVDMTLEAWVYIPDSIPSSFHGIVVHAPSTSNWYGLWNNGNVFHFRWSTGSVRRTDFATTISPNNWYYVTGVLDVAGNVAITYLDGNVDGTVNDPDPPTPTAGPTYLGHTSSGSEYFKGFIDEVRISKIARSEDWIKASYRNQDSPGSYQTLGGQEEPSIGIDCDFSDWTDGDGTEFVVDDQGGPDDWTIPSKYDITRFGVASNLSDSFYLLFGFDDILPGKTTAAILIDTDLDDNVDFAIAVTLQDAGSTVELFTCDNSVAYGCGGQTLSKIYTTPQDYCVGTATGPWNTDTFVELALPYADLGSFTGGSVIIPTLNSYQKDDLKKPKDSIFEDYYDRILYDTDNGTGQIIDEAGTPTISGTVFSDEGITSMGVGKTVRLLVNGAVAATDTTDDDGYYFMVVPAGAGDNLLAYIDNDATYQGTTVTVFDGVQLADLDIYAGHVITRHDNGGTLSTANMATAKGGYSDTDILYSVSGSTLTVSGSGTELYMPGGHSFTPGGDITTPNMENLGAFNGGSGTIDVNGTLTLSDGSFTSTSGTMSIADDFAHSGGTFSHNSGTVTLDGTGQIISGSTSFNNLTKTVTTADTLTFEAGSTQTIAGTGIVSLKGADGNLLSLVSDTPDTRWNFTLTAGAAKDISYVDVKDSDASGSDATQKPINPANSLNGGNTIDWFPLLPDIIFLKSVQTFSDPFNGESNPKAIPGGVMLYTITATNQGDGATDADTVFITDPIPANTVLFVGDIDGPGPATGPVLFTDGTPPNDSGLSYTFTSLDSLTDDVAFSNDGGGTYTYVPVPDAEGFDTNVTHMRITPKGTFNAASGGDIPTFEVKFKVRVE
ncbi:MAG: DUF2341 domain-containing protein [Deltaproteobacteria bacterium]|nr:DUF2341 domain-containing protein [Deltaproteobacteria bacterium]